MSPKWSNPRRDDVPHHIAAARLERQYLVGTSPHQTAEDVVRALCAVQSQDVAGAKWAIAMRSHGLDEAAIDAAFDRGDIVRTHILRPTWHFVAPEDLRWMQTLTSHRVRRILSTYDARLGFTPSIIRKGKRVVAKALEHGPLTRAQLKAALSKVGIDTDGTQRLAHLVMHAELDSIICSGPQRGKQSTYMLVDQRVTHQRLIFGDEALHELTVRYFASRAPATEYDFAWWSGLTVGECRRGIDITGKQLKQVMLGDTRYYAPTDFELPSTIPTTAHLLPNYDEYFIGFRDRSAIGQRLESSALVTGGNALIAHVVAVDGQLVGGWRRVAERGNTVLRFNLMVKLTPAERKRVKNVVARFAEFAGVRVATEGL